MKTLQHHDLVANQASPETLIAMATGRPVWTKDQIDVYKHEYASRHDVSPVFQAATILVVLLLALVASVPMLLVWMMCRFGFITKARRDTLLDPFMNALARLESISSARAWQVNTSVTHSFTIDYVTRPLPKEVISAMNKIRLLVPDTVYFDVHAFGTDPILEVRVNRFDGMITRVHALVWDIDAKGNLVFIDPPTA